MGDSLINGIDVIMKLKKKHRYLHIFSNKL